MERTAPDLRVRRANWTRLRSLPFLAGLGLRAVRRRALQSVLAAVGTAVAVALAVAAAVGAVAVHDRTLATAVATLPPERQAVAVTWVGTSVRSDDRWPALDRAVRDATGAARWERPARLLAFRQSRVGGRLAWFGALEDLRGAFRLVSGRYPRRCAPTRCEVLQAGPGAAVARASALVPVGRAVARRGSAAGAFFRGGSAAVLVGEGVAEASRVGAFGAFRTYAWLFPLDGRLHPWELDDLERATVTASLRLTRASAGFGLQAPLDELRKVDRRATAAGRRLEVVGVFAGLLLIAFLVLVRLLAESGAERRQRALHHHGAARWQASTSRFSPSGPP